MDYNPGFLRKIKKEQKSIKKEQKSIKITLDTGFNIIMPQQCLKSHETQI